MRRREVIELAGLGLGVGAFLPAWAQAEATNPWRQKLVSERLNVPLYRAAGGASFTQTSWDRAWTQIAGQLVKVRAASWSAAAGRSEKLGFHFDTDLTNEEAYAWAKLARLSGARLERRGERQAIAVARALDTTFGQPAATNHWLDLASSRSIVILGNAAGRPYPAYRTIQAAKAGGAKVWTLSDGTDRPVVGNLLKIAPQSELAILGGLIRFIIDSKRVDLDFIDTHTNAAFRLLPEFDFRGGLFSGFDPKVRGYNPESWSYEYLDGTRPARSENATDAGTVFDRLVRFFGPFTLGQVSRVTGVSEAVLRRFYAEVTAPESRPLSFVYTLSEATQPDLAEQQVRACAIASLLLGQVGRPGGGIVVLAPGWNPQGTLDVGAAGGLLPGYSGTPPRPGDDWVNWVQRNGLRSQRRLVALLRSWYEGQAADLGFGQLPRARSEERSFSQSGLEMLVCVGSDPLADAPWPLEKLKTLVVLGVDSQNRTARFWQKRAGTQTEVFFLPLAHPLEREGTITDTGRRIVLFTAERPPQGESQTGLTAVAGLWNRLQPLVAESAEARDRGLQAARWWKELTPTSVMAEMSGEDLRDPSQIDSSLQPQTLRCGVAVYAGVTRDLLQQRRSTEDASKLGLFPNYGYAWPGNVRVIANRASADLEGKSRLTPPFIRWDGEAWVGPDTPDIPPATQPTEPSATRSFRGTPEGVARLFAARFAGGLNPDTGIAFLSAPLPTLGPLPAYYVPWGSKRPNLLSPAQAEPPVPPA